MASSTPDVCILDIELPDSTGYELAADIRRAVSPPPILIALTGFGMARDRQHAIEAGFDHYFVKPADIDALSEVLAGVGVRNADPVKRGKPSDVRAK
jgi:CheY-like chemotaxis protein